MRPSVAWLVGVGIVAIASGCRSNATLVESQLRQSESRVRELREEVDRCGAYNQALEQELRSLRDGSDHDGAPAYPVRSLVLGRGTGGRDEDGLPGDEALEVHIEPRDPEGNAIKAPGMAIVQAAQIGSDGIKRPLANWEISPEKLRQSWRSGLLTTGYVLVLPWQQWPTTEKLRVTVQFRLADGRLFEADKDIHVRVAPLNQHTTPGPIVVPAPESPGPSIGDETLPTPRQTGKDRKDGVRRPTEAGGAQEVRPAAEILRPVPLARPTGAGNSSAPARMSSAN